MLIFVWRGRDLCQSCNKYIIINYYTNNRSTKLTLKFKKTKKKHFEKKDFGPFVFFLYSGYHVTIKEFSRKDEYDNCKVTVSISENVDAYLCI